MDELAFDEAVLFLDDQHVLQPIGETAGTFHLQRPDQTDLVDAQAERFAGLLRQAEVSQRLADIEISLAGGENAETRRRRIQCNAVDLVGARECRHRLHLGAMQPLLRLERRIGPADMNSGRRHDEIGGFDELHALRIDRDRRRAFRRFRNRLETDPAARVTRQRETIDAEVEIFLHRCRIQDRHHCRLENLFALVSERRGLAAMIVAGERQHTAIARRACGVGMLQRIRRAIDAGTLAVPDAEHALRRRARKHADLLTAPHRRRREILIQSRLELNVLRGEVSPRAPERVVIGAKRRAAVTTLTTSTF